MPTQRPTQNKYVKNYDFSYRLPGPPVRDCNFTVTAVLGHLTSHDFGPEHRKWASVDPFALFDAPIITSVSEDMKGVERNLRAESRGAQRLMIWTDCDREGEHIGKEIVDVCRASKPAIQVSRAHFSAIIPASAPSSLPSGSRPLTLDAGRYIKPPVMPVRST